MFRILANLLLFLSVLFLPVYVSIVLILVCIFLFNNFAESIAFGFLLDLFYSGGNVFGLNFAYFITSFIFVFYLVSFKLKTILRL